MWSRTPLLTIKKPSQRGPVQASRWSRLQPGCPFGLAGVSPASTSKSSAPFPPEWLLGVLHPVPGPPVSLGRGVVPQMLEMG